MLQPSQVKHPSITDLLHACDIDLNRMTLLAQPLRSPVAVSKLPFEGPRTRTFAMFSCWGPAGVRSKLDALAGGNILDERIAPNAIVVRLINKFPNRRTVAVLFSHGVSAGGRRAVGRPKTCRQFCAPDAATNSMNTQMVNRGSDVDLAVRRPARSSSTSTNVSSCMSNSESSSNDKARRSLPSKIVQVTTTESCGKSGSRRSELSIAKPTATSSASGILKRARSCTSAMNRFRSTSVTARRSRGGGPQLSVECQDVSPSQASNRIIADRRVGTVEVAEVRAWPLNANVGTLRSSHGILCVVVLAPSKRGLSFPLISSCRSHRTEARYFI